MESVQTKRAVVNPLSAATVCFLSLATFFYNEIRNSVLLPEIVHWNYPTFLHVLLFSFLTASIGGFKRNGRFFIPAMWVALNVVVEVLQKYSVPPFYGTFDWNDIFAAVIGGVVASWMLPHTQNRNCRSLSFVVVTLFGASILTATSEAKRYKTQVKPATSEPTRGDVREFDRPYYDYSHEPIYMTYDDLRRSFAVEKPRALAVSGKILVVGSRLYVSEPNVGIHVFDNTDPSEPKATHFLVVPGNVDLAAKNRVIYADSFIDLIAVDFSGNEPVVSARVEDTFAWDPYQAIQNKNIRFDPSYLDKQRGVIVGSRSIVQPEKPVEGGDDG